MAELTKKVGPDINALARGTSRDLQTTVATAQMLALSGYFKDVKDGSQALARILLGGEMGFAPVSSILLIDFVQGKPRLSSAAMGALIQNSKDYDFRVVTLNNELVTIDFYKRKPDGELGVKLGTSSFSKQDAETAGLIKPNTPHKLYPRNMLYARAMSNGFHFFTPGLAAGIAGRVYGPGELPGDAGFTEDDYVVLDDADVVNGQVVLKQLPAPTPVVADVLGKVAKVAPAVADLLKSREPKQPEVFEAKVASVALTQEIVNREPDGAVTGEAEFTPEEILEFPSNMQQRVESLTKGSNMPQEDLKALNLCARNTLGSLDKTIELWKTLDVVPKSGVSVPARTVLSFIRKVSAASAAGVGA